MTVEAFTVWGLQTGLMVSFLIGLVLVIRRPFARYFGANAAYALWLLPAIRLVLPPMTVPFIKRKVLPAEGISETAQGKGSPVGVPNLAPFESQEQVPNDAADPSSVKSLTTLPVEQGATVSDIATPKSEHSIINAADKLDPVLTPNVMETTFDLLQTMQAILPVLTVIWLAVAGLWFIFQLYRQNHFMTVIKANGVKPSHSLYDPIREAMALTGLKTEPDVLLSEMVSGPMVTGVLSPLIVLPLDFEDKFAPHQRSFALIHEMAHIKRGDLWVALGVLGFRALFWPNPLVHYAAHKMRVDQEAACDASVLAKAGGKAATHSYAETLIHAAKAAGNKRDQAPLGLALSDQGE